MFYYTEWFKEAILLWISLKSLIQMLSLLYSHVNSLQLLALAVLLVQFYQEMQLLTDIASLLEESLLA